MFRKAVLLMCLVLIASVAMGQQSDAAFWQTPGNTVRDAKGNITYTQTKDPKNFTVKIFDRGHWVTYHYEPNTTKVARVEGPDTSEDYLYDGDNWNGVTVHAHGRSHSIHATDTTVTADDMPPITIVRDEKGRDTAVKRGSDVVATISYDANGQVRRLTAGAMSLDFNILSSGVREVLTANGTVLVTTVAKAHGKRQLPVSLDPVADHLGLGSDWRNSVQFNRSATGSLISVSDALQRPIAEIVQFGEMSAAFDTQNSPLFYELRLRYAANPVVRAGDGDAFADPTTALAGILPDGLIIPVTGDASPYVSRPGDGAISSLWSVTGGSTPSYRFIVYHEGAKPTATNLRTPPVTSSVAVASAMSRGRAWTITPLMMWQCGSEEHWSCDSSGGSGYCYNYYTPVYCDSSGGGGYDPPPDDSGGGSGGGAGPGNHVTGDAALTVAVNSALSTAAAKFGNTHCSQDLFKDTKLSDGTTSLADVLAQRGTNAASWLSNSLRYVNGFTNGSCASFPAWTLVNDTTVNVCTSFKNLAPSTGAVILIHEELHSLGLTEKPGYPNAAMDASQITQLVMAYCGA